MSANVEVTGKFTGDAILAYAENIGVGRLTDVAVDRFNSTHLSQVMIGLALMKKALVEPRLTRSLVVFRRDIPAEQNAFEQKGFVVDLSTRSGRERLLYAYTDLLYIESHALRSNEDMEDGFRKAVLYLDDLTRGIEPRLGGGS